MAKKREFGDGPIFTITDYATWFFGLNFLFIICNILVIITAIAFGEKLFDEGFIPLIISSILSGPAITAMCSTMGKLVREKDIKLFKDYFKAYKLNFKQSMIIWLIILLVVTIIFIDIKSYPILNYPKFVLVVFYALLFWVILISTFIFPILSRFHLKIKELLRVSFICCFSNIKTTISNLAVIILCFFLSYKLPSFSVLIIASVFFYLLMYSMNNLLKTLEEKK